MIKNENKKARLDWLGLERREFVNEKFKSYIFEKHYDHTYNDFTYNDNTRNT